VSLLIPKFHPVTWSLLAAFYLLCLVCGGETNSEVVQGAWPLVLLGGALAAGAIKEGLANKRAKEGIKAQKEAEAKRLKGIETSMAPLVEPAQERIADPDSYKESDASKRGKAEEIQTALEAQTRAEEAELKRGAGASPFGSGRRDIMMDSLRKRRSDALAGAKLGIERQSDVMAAQKKAQDEATLKNYAAMKAGLPPSAVPGMIAATPGFGERMMGTVTQGITAAGTMGIVPPMPSGGAATPSPDGGEGVAGQSAAAAAAAGAGN